MFSNVKCQLPGPNSKKFLDESVLYEASPTSQQAPIVWDSASGALIKDVDGNTYIDFTSGVLVTNVGHCHPKLVDRVQKAVAKLMNCYDFTTPERVTVAKRLVEVAPENLDVAFMVTTGSDATEAAMRIAKRYTGRFEILSFYGGFHGRTGAAMSAAGTTGTKKLYGPVMPGAIQAPYAYCYRCPFKCKPETCDFLCVDFLDNVIAAQSTGSLAALIVEPYQGSSGFIFPPEGYLTRLQEWAKSKDILFILDEVQASFGRTGKMFALEWENLRPNLLCLGKGLGSGIPAAAVLAESRITKSLATGELSSTNGGNPVSCAAALAVLDIMAEENLCENALKVGPYLLERFKAVQKDVDILGDVRGKGLVIGLEFVTDKESKTPSGEIAAEVIRRCCQNGLVIGRVGSHGHILRVAPPLVITMEQAEEAADIMEKVLREF
jgi:4-aminobutyrate aminotransferase